MSKPGSSVIAPGRRTHMIVALTALALLVRIPGAGGDLWLDEIATLLSSVRPPLLQILTTFESPNNHIFYSVLSHISVSIFGESSWALRLPAVVFGALCVPALYLLAERWVPRREAFAAALVLALSYHHAYFSQNARGYTGFIMLTMLSAVFLVRAFDTDKRGYWIAYVVATAANIYMLLSGVFAAASIALGAILCFVLPAPKLQRWRRAQTFLLWLAAAAALTLLFYAPLLGSLIHAFGAADPDVGWRPSWALLRVMARDAAPGGDPLIVMGAVLALPVLVIGAIALIRRAPFLLFVLALPPVLELGAALTLGAGTYPRRFLIVLPLLILFAVRGVAVVTDWLSERIMRPQWRRPAFAGAIAAGVVVAAAGLPKLYTTPKQDYTGALAFIEQQRAPEDLVAAAYVTTTGMQLYGPQVQPARTAADLQRLLEGGRTVWLLATFLPDMQQREPELSRMIHENFQPQAQFAGLVGDGSIHVWRSNAKTQPHAGQIKANGT